MHLTGQQIGLARLNAAQLAPAIDLARAARSPQVRASSQVRPSSQGSTVSAAPSARPAARQRGSAERGERGTPVGRAEIPSAPDRARRTHLGGRTRTRRSLQSWNNTKDETTAEDGRAPSPPRSPPQSCCRTGFLTSLTFTHDSSPASQGEAEQHFSAQMGPWRSACSQSHPPMSDQRLPAFPQVYGVHLPPSSAQSPSVPPSLDPRESWTMAPEPSRQSFPAVSPGMRLPPFGQKSPPRFPWHDSLSASHGVHS